jgi:NAD(P)-dependent dehydrogenase (short-subunit alcohol dehydrogenase family)
MKRAEGRGVMAPIMVLARSLSRSEQATDHRAPPTRVRDRKGHHEVPELCAEAILWLAGERSGRTTGHVIPVDGGLPEAFLR